jgi:hypothetical protein
MVGFGGSTTVPLTDSGDLTTVPLGSFGDLTTVPLGVCGGLTTVPLELSVLLRIVFAWEYISRFGLWWTEAASGSNA